MEYEKEKKIREQFPEDWFPKRFFGFEVGDGWFQILWDMFEELEKVPLSTDEKPFGFLQIKEKFGTLRLYTIGGNHMTANIIHDAEVKASETCSVCGEKGRLRNEGWITVRCDMHIV